MVLPPKADFFLSKYTLVSIPANSINLHLPGMASEQYQLCLFGVLREMPLRDIR